MSNPSASNLPVLPEWQVSTWLNAEAPITLESLRGRVVLLHTFQMLCPGCVAYGLPQAQRVSRAFPESELAVIGLHTVFEHHAVMTVEALRAFVHEYRWSFPIGVDQPDGRDGLPITMARYGLQGTPSCLVLDQEGRVRLNHLGQIGDLELGALLGRLVARPAVGLNADARPAASSAGATCAIDGCSDVASGLT